MNYWIIASCALAAFLYIPLCLGIIRGTIKQNVATWALWTTLDTIATLTVMIQGGNFWMIAVYTVGGVAVSLSILRSRNFAWTSFESFVAVLVVGCMIVWWSSGSRDAAITSSIAVFIAGIPQIIDSWKKPWDTPIITLAGFTLCNVLSTIGGKEWSVEERFYPALCTVLTTLITLGALQKLWRKNPTSTST